MDSADSAHSKPRRPTGARAGLIVLALLAALAGGWLLRAAVPPQQIPHITSSVELVNMVFTVEDSHGAFVTGLHAADFRVLEDGRPQTIRDFSEESNLPLTLGLLIDTSGSQRNVLSEEQAASRLLLQDTIHESDRAFVVSFDRSVYLLQDLTNSQARLDAALDRARIGGSTSLWDAIFLSCKARMAQQTGRKAIVVMTDGGATPSEYTAADATRVALDTGTVVFFVDISDLGFAGEGPGDLETLAKSSGGRTFDGNNKKLAAAFAQIEDTLRHQYTLAYRSDRPQHDGKFRRVQIRPVALKHVTIRTRTGYTMPKY